MVETPAYLSAATQAGITDAERARIVNLLAAAPDSGDIMESTGGARKLRVAGRGRGKSGGYRVITFHGDPTTPVFLITVFGKGERDNLAKAERNALAALTARLKMSRKKAP